MTMQIDFGGTLPPRSRCIYSRWSGYLERPDWQTTIAALAKANGDLIEVHTSGHIFYDDIVYLGPAVRQARIEGPGKSGPQISLRPNGPAI
jgi:ribonuclease J